MFKSKSNFIFLLSLTLSMAVQSIAPTVDAEEREIVAGERIAKPVEGPVVVAPQRTLVPVGTPSPEEEPVCQLDEIPLDESSFGGSPAPSQWESTPPTTGYFSAPFSYSKMMKLPIPEHLSARFIDWCVQGCVSQFNGYEGPIQLRTACILMCNGISPKCKTRQDFCTVLFFVCGRFGTLTGGKQIAEKCLAGYNAVCSGL